MDRTEVRTAGGSRRYRRPTLPHKPREGWGNLWWRNSGRIGQPLGCQSGLDKYSKNMRLNQHHQRVPNTPNQIMG